MGEPHRKDHKTALKGQQFRLVLVVQTQCLHTESPGERLSRDESVRLDRHRARRLPAAAHRTAAEFRAETSPSKFA